ncbi:MAG: molybdopterin-dependent oxidoreductase [Gammaproteobacteria bacterium]|nr:molybdopterin-dependent oxidoreductase [Gammaproteobacteria bacterium]MDE0303029.1 molybdopterin-dependent oxidoreductase [Gammaproteobacteria bacterium]MDE0611869.1 molybdopterin-dependent oxidoreductase [Gammaproteobacteria bacterium]
MTQVSKIKVPEGHSLHHVCCPHDCPDTCSMLVTRDDSTGRAVRVQGDPTHPVTRGYLCNKVNHYLDLVYNDNRVLYPHKRVGPRGPGAKFERISWDEALDMVTDNFKEVIAEYGSEAVQPYSYSGTLGMLGYWAMDQRFWNKMEAARLEQSICIYAAMWAGIHTYGVANGPAVHDAVQDAELIVLWGANLVSTGVHAIPFIREAQERGAKLIVIDPRITRTTMMADWHIQPRPGTDAALALGAMKVIVDNGLHDEAFLREQTIGWEQFINEKLPEYPLDKVSEITGVSEADIEKFGLMYGKAKKSFIRANYGLNRHQNSGQTCRAILVMPCITGSWREPNGGAAFGTLEEMWLQFNLAKLQRPDLGNRAEKRVVNMVQIGRALADHIGVDDKPLDPPIKSIFVYNSDPANCAPNSGNVRRGLMRDDLFVAVHDTFWTDTCNYADVVLPADTQLERMDLHAAYGHWHFNLNKAVIEPLGESCANTELFRRMAQKMGYVEEGDNAFTQTDEEMIRDILFDEEVNPLMEGITYEQLEKNGWARASDKSKRRDFLNIGWPTASKKIEIFSQTLADEGQDPLPTYNPEVEGQEDPKRKDYPIQVLSSAAHYFIGDSFQSVPRLQAMMSRPTVEMSVNDAKERGIEDGDLVRLYNDRGETYCYAVVINGLLDGVCATQKQFKGSNTPGGINVNVLNSEMLTDFGMSPTFYSCLAEIEKADPETTKKARLKELGGVDGYVAAWRNKNRDSDASDDQILEYAKQEHPEIFN